MKKFIPFLMFIFLFFVSNLNAQDTTYSNLGDVAEFNVFVIGSADFSSSDIQGRAAIGGNAHFTNFSIGDQIPNSSGAVDILVVGDSLWYNGGRVYSGNVVYGEFADVSDNLILDGEGTVYQGSPVDFSTMGLQVADISLQWGALVSNGSVSTENGALVLSGSNPSLNIFTVQGDELSSANGITVNAPEGSTVLVNINGSIINWDGDNDLFGVNQTHVVYNFYEADTLTLSGIAVKGSILAPFAFIDFVSGQANGNIIAHDIQGEGQINYSWFQGNIEYDHSDLTSGCYVTMRNILKGYTVRLSEPFFGHTRYWAGTLLGEVNSHSTSFYCIDISHYLKWNQPYQYDGKITGSIAYILRNYYPFVPFTGTNGQLHRVRKEAAAVQIAIWHFSDGFDPNLITNSNAIKNRALEIIDAATDQNPPVLHTFEVTPASQVINSGQTAMLKVVAKDSDGNPMEGVEVEITSTAGTVEPSEGTTDANGEFVFAVHYDETTEPDEATITVTTMEAALPPGSRYILENAQTLVTNDELITCLTTYATVYWSKSALPGNDYDFYMYSTNNSSIPANYITAVSAHSDFVYFGTANNGAYKFNRSSEEFESLELDNQNITALISDEDGNKIAVGFQTDGFAVIVNGETTYFNSTNSDFSGSHVYAFETLNQNDTLYLVIAHDAGLSLFNTVNQAFTNYNSTNSDLPPGVCYDVARDDEGGLWVATDYGLAHRFVDGSWEIFTDTSSGINGNYIRSVEYGDSEVMVGTFYNGICGYDVYNHVWTNYTPFISTQPVMNIYYADGKFFIANWSEGLYVYDGENFKQYSSVSQTNAPSIIEDFSFDGEDVWFATQQGLSRTTNGSSVSNGDAEIIISDDSTYTGGSVTLACNLVADDEIEFYRLSGTILFNNSELEFVDYALDEAFSGCVVHLNEVSPGRIEFTAISNDEAPINESGTMFNLMFNVSEDLAPLGSGISAVYCTNFTSGFGTELTHEDLGIVSWTSSGTGNAGVGDASLDGRVDMTDYLKVVHHYAYGGNFTLRGDAFHNGDVDSTAVINSCDASKLLSFLDNGCFPFQPTDAQPSGGFEPAAVTYDEENNISTVNLVANNVDNFNGMTIKFEYDSAQVDYNTFSSIQIGSGDYVHATELTPTSATFIYNAPTNLSGTFELGNITFNISGTKDEPVTVNTSYSLDGVNYVDGPVITLNVTGVESDEVPSTFKLYQNYPNPFNPSTTIKYAVPKNVKVTLKIYDLLGREIATLVNDVKSPGVYSVKWNGKTMSGQQVSSGVYFYRLEAGNFVKVNKMILLK